ncbi:cyclic peptide export ABC transporter [Pseudomonas entomophila]|uniref:cyclic peptide export ABC transporter n=1 Tax=Pseudomonas entomophila TaxID=312306 RepID=UPI0023D7CC01|nr:cyclic peptide export ABC transporter [Pseudomonas entomophila]MDF0733009.1 cyclic peptide export ABC transporter [Pseudomonas entomophila]
MRMIRLLLEQSGLSGVLVLLLAQAVAGLASAGVLMILTRVAGEAADVPHWRSLAWVLAGLALLVVAQCTTSRLTIDRVERSVHVIRMRLMNKSGSASLRSFERVRQGGSFATLEKLLKTISGATVAIIAAGQSAIVLICTMVYLAYLSPTALVLCMVVMGLSLLLHFARMRPITRSAGQALAAESVLTGLAAHLLGGFKELKLNRQRQRDFFDELDDASSNSMRLNRVAYVMASDHLVVIQLILYAFIGVVVFGMPALAAVDPVLLVKIVAVILFLSGALNHFVSILPLYAMADAAVAQVECLERELDEATVPERVAHTAEPDVMSVIELDDVRFSYGVADGGGFGVGPLNLTLRQGEIVFVTGGNGSGKSTFLKLLTGLQLADQGTLRLNGAVIEPEHVAAYRNLFSAVFWDFYLFPTLYGLASPGAGVVEAHLARLSLDGKTHFDGRSFSTTDLSTGQRKRLAHLVALLEDRQIYVFDEWAADQDPTFRRWFYRTELPRLKAMGKTVIAVTHDEQYFACADRWLHFEEGRCTEVHPVAVAAAGAPPAWHALHDHEN